MDGVVCIPIDGAINACRVYGIMSRASDGPSLRMKGAMGGFVMGAIAFGLPLWGIYSILKHFLF
jgi:hypothetical protein